MTEDNWNLADNGYDCVRDIKKFIKKVKEDIIKENKKCEGMLRFSSICEILDKRAGKL